MTDAQGFRRKFGVLGPSTNTIVQPDFDDMRPHGVTNHYSRIFTPNANAVSNESFRAGANTIADNVLTSTAEEAAVYVTQSDPTASRVTILGNVLRLPAPAQPKYGVWAQAQGVTITGNSIDQRALILAGAAIRLEPIGQQDLATRCTVVGNAIEPSTAGAGPAILIESDENACSTNACSLAAPPATAAIQISGNNNTCLANVCRTAPAVLNTGAGNEVAHNI